MTAMRRCDHLTIGGESCGLPIQEQAGSKRNDSDLRTKQGAELSVIKSSVAKSTLYPTG